MINIAGLAIGMACCILILIWVQDELSYDRFHEHAGRIFRIITENHAGDEVTVSAGSPAPLGRTLVETFPDIQESVRVQSGWNNWFLRYGEKTFAEEKLAAVDPAFFEVFSFPFLKGDPKTALVDPNSIVLTERSATRCSADEGPMGKVMQMDDFDLKVTGVVKDIPRNSHLQFDYAFPAENMREWRSSQLDSWDYMQIATLVSNLLAWPAAFLITRRWLAGFAYRTRLGWEIFVFSALLALLIALFSVGSQALRAAVADPVQSLRYE